MIKHSSCNSLLTVVAFNDTFYYTPCCIIIYIHLLWFRAKHTVKGEYFGGIWRTTWLPNCNSASDFITFHCHWGVHFFLFVVEWATTNNNPNIVIRYFLHLTRKLFLFNTQLNYRFWIVFIIIEYRDVFWNLSNIYDGAFCENSYRLSATYYLSKTLHLRWLTVFRVRICSISKIHKT